MPKEKRKKSSNERKMHNYITGLSHVTTRP
jgi:hypothetical protein